MTGISNHQGDSGRLELLLEESRSLGKDIGLGNVSAGTAPEDELRHYFTELMFGTKIRLEKIAAALRHGTAEDLKLVVASEQPHLAQELRVCSDIFQCLCS